MEMNGQSSRQDEEVVEAWRQISSIVHRARHATLPSSTNDVLANDRGTSAEAYVFAACAGADAFHVGAVDVDRDRGRVSPVLMCWTSTGCA